MSHPAREAQLRHPRGLSSMFDCDQWIVHKWVRHSCGYLHQHTSSGDSILVKHIERNLPHLLLSHHYIYGSLFQTWHFLFLFCVFKQKSRLKSHSKSTRHIISTVFVAFNPVACVCFEAVLGEISLTASSKLYKIQWSFPGNAKSQKCLFNDNETEICFFLVPPYKDSLIKWDVHEGAWV